jgi:hypothetical protein
VFASHLFLSWHRSSADSCYPAGQLYCTVAVGQGRRVFASRLHVWELMMAPDILLGAISIQREAGGW